MPEVIWRFYISCNGIQYGPHEEATVSQWISERRIGATDYLRREDQTQWQTVEQYQQDLFQQEITSSSAYSTYRPQQAVRYPETRVYVREKSRGKMLGSFILAAMVLTGIIGSILLIKPKILNMASNNGEQSARQVLDMPVPGVLPTPTAAMTEIPTADPVGIPAAPIQVAAGQPSAEPKTSQVLQRLDRDIAAKRQRIVSAENELEAIELRGQQEIICPECNGKGYKEKTVRYWWRNDGSRGDHSEIRIEKIPCKRCNETGKLTSDTADKAAKAKSQQRLIDRLITELDDLKKLRDQEWNRLNPAP